MDWSKLPVDVSVSFVVASVFMTYFFVGGLLFSAHSLFLGRYTDPELERRGSSAVLILLLRLYFAWLMKPLLFVLTRCRIPPNAVTGVSVLLAVIAGIAVARGDFALGGWLYLGSGFCDFLDGRLARILNQVTPSGSLLDSTLDRYSEAAVLMGMSWFYRDSWVLFVFLLFLTGSFLVPYVRARGEALGIEMKIGLMQRPERLVILGLASSASPILMFGYPGYSRCPVKHPIVVVVAMLLAFATQATAAHRLWHLIGEMRRRNSTVPTEPAVTVQQVCFFLLLTIIEFVGVVSLVRFAGLSVWIAAGAASLLSSLAIFGTQPRSSAGSSRIAAIVGTAVLTSCMLAVLAWVPVLDYRLSWLLGRSAVALAWIYPLWLGMKAK